MKIEISSSKIASLPSKPNFTKSQERIHMIQNQGNLYANILSEKAKQVTASIQAPARLVEPPVFNSLTDGAAIRQPRYLHSQQVAKRTNNPYGQTA